MKKSVISKKSFAFAVRVVRLYQYLVKEKQEYVLAKQLVRSGTSIGANVEEAISAFSRADFLYKLTLSLKEARETSYWLRLLHKTDYISDQAFESVFADCEELIRILVKIIRTTLLSELRANG